MPSPSGSRRETDSDLNEAFYSNAQSVSKISETANPLSFGHDSNRDNKGATFSNFDQISSGHEVEVLAAVIPDMW